MNVIPNKAAHTLAARLMYEAERETPFDALINHLDHLVDLGDDVYPLIGILLNHTRPLDQGGRPRLAEAYTSEQQRRANARYAAGDRSPEVVAAYREYQRVSKRGRREQKEAS